MATAPASESAGAVVIRVTIGLATLLLEHQRVRRRWTCGRRCVRSATAIFRTSERVTSAPAPHNDAVWTRQGQLGRADAVHVALAVDHSAVTGTTIWTHRHGKVEAVDKADVVEILSLVTCQSHLGEGSRWDSTCAVALEVPGSTVSGLALEPSGGISGAVGSCPHTARPLARDI